MIYIFNKAYLSLGKRTIPLLSKNLMGAFLPCLPCFGYIILVLALNWIRLGLTVREKKLLWIW